VNTEGIGISWGVGGSLRPKSEKECIKFDWNFQRGGGSWIKSLPWERYGYFLELHIVMVMPRLNTPVVSTN